MLICCPCLLVRPGFIRKRFPAIRISKEYQSIIVLKPYLPAALARAPLRALGLSLRAASAVVNSAGLFFLVWPTFTFIVSRGVRRTFFAGTPYAFVSWGSSSQLV